MLAWSEDGRYWLLTASSGLPDTSEGLRRGGMTKEELARVARQLGATHVVNATEGDPVEQVKELTGGGVDFAFEAIGSKQTGEQAFRMLRPRGVATIKEERNNPVQLRAPSRASGSCSCRS